MNPRSSFALAAALAFAMHLHAQTVGELIPAVRNFRSTAVRSPIKVGPHIVYNDSVGPSLLFPVTGNLQGGFGTFFRSEVVISNFREATQRIAISVLERGKSSANTQVIYRDLISYHDGGDLALVDEDFLASLGRTGLAAILVTGVDANGKPDPNAILDGFTRIYTLQPQSEGCTNPTGTVSQAMVAVPPTSLAGDASAGFAIGLRQDENFRTNVGIVNLGAVDHEFEVLVYGTRASTTMSVRVPAYSMEQAALPPGNWGNIALVVSIKEGFAQHPEHGWAAYGTSVDNRTGDGWVRQATY